MDPLNKIFLINERLVGGESLTDGVRAELAAAVEALRQQRATTLAACEAKVVKHNRNLAINRTVDSYAPVEVVIDNCRLHVSEHISGDPIADRLAACWNFCRTIPTEQLQTSRATEFMPDA